MATDILTEEAKAPDGVLPEVTPEEKAAEARPLSIDDLAEMSDEDLAKVMDLAHGQKNAPKPDAKAEAKAEPEKGPVEEPAKEPEKSEIKEEGSDEGKAPETKTDDEPPPAPGKLPDRIRLNSYDEGDKKLILAAHGLARELGIPFVDAFDRVRGKAKDDAPAKEPEKAAPDPNKEPETSAEIEARLEELEAKIAEQTELGDVLEANKLLAKSNALIRKLSKVQATEAAEGATQEIRFQQELDASKARMLNEFPEFKDEDGALKQLALTIQDAWKFRKDPRLQEATAPEQIVNEAAAKLGIKPLSQRKEAGGAKPTAPQATGSAAPNGAAIPSKPRMNPLAPASAGAAALAGRGGMDRAQMIEMAAKMSDEEFAKACQEAGLNRK